MSRDNVFVEESLTALLEELESQPEMAIFFASGILGYEDTLSNIENGWKMIANMVWHTK